MTDTDRMVVWLREALDAAEQIARAACLDGAGHWQHHGYVSGADVSGDHDGYHVACDEGYPTLEQAQHIALNDPHNVLRRIAADRELLDECETILSDPRLKDYKPGEFGGLRGYPHALAVSLAEVAIRNRAEAWGWTEEEQR